MSTISLPDVMLGAQEPRHLSLPPRVSSAGQEASELAASAGLFLDPWQRLVLDGALGERADGQWSAFEVALIVSRQNGKGSLIEARELAGLYLFGESLIMHTAHEFKTAKDAFYRILSLIEGSAALSKRLAGSYSNNQNVEINLRPKPTIITGSTGQRITRGRPQALKFIARTTGSGRGFPGDVVVLDEAFHLPEGVMSALMPTMSARPNPQLWYTSSPVNQEEHAHGVVLARIRARGLRGDDPSLAYFEWQADEEAYEADPQGVATDPRAWADSNPGLGIRISAEHVAREQRSMGQKAFAVERLSIGDWPDVDNAASQVVDPEVWAKLADPESVAGDCLVFAADCNPERTAAAIAVCGGRGDGQVHGEVVDQRSGTGWVPARLVELVERWKPREVLLDPSGPGGSWLTALQEAGIEPVLVSGREMAQACGGWYEAVTEHGTFRHLNQSSLNDALRGAKTRPLSDAWAWARRDSTVNISPLVAVTLAHYGYARFGGEPDQVLW